MRLKKFDLYSQKNFFDLSLLMSVLGLVIFGLVMVYDASVTQGLRDFQDANYYIRQQLIWTLIGLTVLFLFSRFDYKKFKLLAKPLIIISTLLLLAVFIPSLGISGGGAHRWLNIGPVTLQPAEIIKITGIIFLATIFEKRTRFLPFASLVIVMTIITALLQRDLGSTVVFVLTVTAVYFAAGAPIWHFFVALPAALTGFTLLIITSAYRSKRILAFMDPFSDPQGFTYHILQVLIALGSGGLLGLGLGHSRQKFEYIPEVVTDSIFAVVGEELGFLGGLFLIFLFAFVVYRGLKIAENCSDNFGRILALGLISLIGIQAIINISSMIALLPLTGVPLPFISYGGSALVANLTAVGILLNISKNG
ncbi:MAG: putative lipid II flippase FtsW [Candidatus Daviesbacteria bacterium]|nr:putative lipid II flippase FtsW [Candidatus Daviesbacteria bacterium]